MPYRIALPRAAAKVVGDAYKRYAATAPHYTSAAHRQASMRLAMVLRAGRAAGWSCSSLAAAAGDISGERVRQIAQSAAAAGPGLSIPSFPLFADVAAEERARRQGMRRRPTRPSEPAGHLTSQERADLARLAPYAAATKGSSPLGGRNRQASEEFTRLLADLRQRKNVPWQELAEATRCYTNPRSLERRLQRHGFGRPSPSVSAYRGITIYDAMNERRNKVAPGKQPSGESTSSSTEPAGTPAIEPCALFCP